MDGEWYDELVFPCSPMSGRNDAVDIYAQRIAIPDAGGNMLLDSLTGFRAAA